MLMETSRRILSGRGNLREANEGEGASSTVVVVVQVVGGHFVRDATASCDKDRKKPREIRDAVSLLSSLSLAWPDESRARGPVKIRRVIQLYRSCHFDPSVSLSSTDASIGAQPAEDLINACQTVPANPASAIASAASARLPTGC